MKSHQQLVKEWKEKLKEEFWFMKMHHVDKEQAMSVFVAFAFAAARGAAEAGRVEKRKPYFIGRQADTGAILHNGTIDGQYGCNAAISQSERQLEDYFKEI